MDRATRQRLRSHLALVSPGTDLRDGLDRIVTGRTGARARMSAPGSSSREEDTMAGTG